MKGRTIVAAVLAVSLGVSFTSVLAQPARAHHFTIINGQCFNPAGNLIPAVAAIHNPHCIGIYQPPGGGEEPGGGDNGHGKGKKSGHESRSAGKLVVGCVMGSAFGLITASVVKGGGLKWMTQKEFESKPRDRSKDLTNNEAAAIAFSCGLATPLVVANFKQAPKEVAKKKVVKAKY
jgi:hypothetical protein